MTDLITTNCSDYDCNHNQSCDYKCNCNHTCDYDDKGYRNHTSIACDNRHNRSYDNDYP